MHRLAGVAVAADDLDAEFRSLLLDAGRPGSAAHSLDGAARRAARACATSSRRDTWRAFGATDRAAAALRASARTATRSPRAPAGC